MQWESANVAAKSTGQYVPVNYENGNYEAHSPIGVSVSWFECYSHQLRIQRITNASKIHITEMEHRSKFHFHVGSPPEAQFGIAESRLRRDQQVLHSAPGSAALTNICPILGNGRQPSSNLSSTHMWYLRSTLRQTQIFTH